MAQYTPMIMQYLEIKKQATDAFLFFRLGDFYELFFEDAKLASRELEITLTGRDGGAKERIPMCGVPYHSAENYIARLIDKGYKVAICEQVEAPQQGKGVVKREIVRVVTPGTYTEVSQDKANHNNFMVSMLHSGSSYALAACDLSTGELYHTCFEGTWDQFMDEVMMYEPSEIMAEASLWDSLSTHPPLQLKNVVMTESSVPSSYAALLERTFSSQEVAALQPVGKMCIAMLVDYIARTQKRALTHITHIQTYTSNQYMVIDPFSRRNLELTETVRDHDKKGSLLWLLDDTVTSMGGRLLRRWLDKPLMNEQHIHARLEAIETLVDQVILREDVRSHLKGIYDLERLVGKISLGNVNARDLVALRQSLQQVPLLVQECAQSSSSTLKQMSRQVDLCQDVHKLIDHAIVDEPPLTVKEGGMFKKGFDAYLDQLREASSNGKQWIAELEKQEREDTGIKSLKVGYNKVFGYYLEVRKANIHLLPEGKYERKQTLTNAERYITPQLKEKEALILEAEDKMTDLEYDMFLQLREQLLPHIPKLQSLATFIAEMDVLQSLSTISSKYQFVKPEVSAKYALHVEAGRHPVVEKVLEDEHFIANDCHLHEEEAMMLITGPNMAGKSTYMRQVALILTMAQIGCFVPAKRAVLPIVDRIFTRIGAADDLVGGQSTFMTEMKDIQTMTEKATSQSLLIIDELGRGTSTGEGMAIAQSVIEFIHEKIGCKTLVSTHFHELAHLEESLSRLKNYSMAVSEKENKVTFLRKLVEGAASSSYGIYCAQIAGLPSSVIDRAYSLLQGQAYEEDNNNTQVILSSSGFDAKQTNGFIAESAIDSTSEFISDQTSDATSTSTSTFTSEPISKLDAEPEQLSLFQGSKEMNSIKKKEIKQGNDKYVNNIMDTLKGMDLMNMTPMDAMNMLYDLKKQVK
ncbi:DNA mismatch repair protein MutS [Longirhabdus pacifica]|uniref:DNA mismatch repair protein MutS n=1 Tax=Longirhabdus pacifica TaxID=2305227 RepID=UPI00100930D7|nr:DNA mismatch repair protein MutS [Longirhabdus pacifica]